MSYWLDLSLAELAGITLVSIAVLFIVIFLVLPNIHKYLEHIKIGNNEFKFRALSEVHGPTAQDILEEIKKIQHDDVKIKTLFTLLAKHFLQHKNDLFWEVMLLDSITQSMSLSGKVSTEPFYERMDSSIKRYNDIDKIISVFSMHANQSAKLEKQLIEMITFCQPRIEEWRENLPEKYKTRD